MTTNKEPLFYVEDHTGLGTPNVYAVWDLGGDVYTLLDAHQEDVSFEIPKDILHDFIDTGYWRKRLI